VCIVYLIWILDEPKTTVYEKLIDHALSKSDASMLVTVRQYDYDIENFKFVLLKREEFENEIQYQKYLKT